MDYEDVLERSIPQIEAIRARLPKHIQMKMCPFGGYGKGEENEVDEIEEHTPEDALGFIALFNGVE